MGMVRSLLAPVVTIIVAMFLMVALGVQTVENFRGVQVDGSVSTKPAWNTTPCEYEDSANCFWNAGKAGNGGGHSFYAIQVGQKTCLVYWERAYGRKHNRCFRD